MKTPCVCEILYDWECPHCEEDYYGPDLGEEFDCPFCGGFIELEF